MRQLISFIIVIILIVFFLFIVKKTYNLYGFLNSHFQKIHKAKKKTIFHFFNMGFFLVIQKNINIIINLIHKLLDIIIIDINYNLNLIHKNLFLVKKLLITAFCFMLLIISFIFFYYTILSFLEIYQENNILNYKDLESNFFLNSKYFNIEITKNSFLEGRFFKESFFKRFFEREIDLDKFCKQVINPLESRLNKDLKHFLYYYEFCQNDYTLLKGENIFFSDNKRNIIFAPSNEISYIILYKEIFTVKYTLLNIEFLGDLFLTLEKSNIFTNFLDKIVNYLFSSNKLDFYLNKNLVYLIDIDLGIFKKELIPFPKGFHIDLYKESEGIKIWNFLEKEISNVLSLNETKSDSLGLFNLIILICLLQHILLGIYGIINDYILKNIPKKKNNT